MPSDPFVITGNEYTKVKNKKLERLAKFKEKVYALLQEKGIATIEEMFNCAKEVFEKFVWSTQTIENLSRYLMSCPEFYRIVLRVKDNKPLVLFPGHHKVDSTSFFVLKKDDQTEDLAKADALMEQLIANAPKPTKKKKGGTRKANNAPNEMIDPQEEALKVAPPEKIVITAKMDKNMTCHSTVSRNYGYINSKRIRSQLIHEYIARQFGYQKFSLSECIENMPLSLFAEIGGIEQFPRVLKEEPMLFNVIIKCFPKKFLDKLNYQSGYDDIVSLLNSLTDGKANNKILAKNGAKYSLLKDITIIFPPVFQEQFQLGKLEDIPRLWQSFMIIELLEQVDPNSNALWKKRFLLHFEKQTSQFMKPAKYYIEKFIKQNEIAKEFPLNCFKLEEFLKKVGLNYGFLEGHLMSMYNSNKDDIVKQFVPKSGPVSLFCRGESSDGLQFTINPESIIDHIDPNSFKWIKDVKAHVALNYFTSLFSVSPRGALISTPRRWNSILELIKTYGSPTEQELHQLQKTHSAHLFSIAYHRDYRDLFNYNMATASITAKKISSKADGFVLMTSDYNWRNSILRLGWKMDPSLGEMIERMRMVSLCPYSIFRASKAEQILTAIDDSKVNEAVIFLKFTKFLSKPADEGAGSESPYRFSRCSIMELKQKVPISYWAVIARDIDSISQATHQDPSLNGKILNNPGSCSFLVLPSCTAKLDLATDRFIEASTSDTLSRSLVTLTDDKSFDIFTIKVDRLSLPLLKVADTPDAKDISLENSMPPVDFTSYPSQTCNSLHRGYMQSYVVFFQVFAEKDLDFLLVIRMVYSFVSFRFLRGCSLDEIISHFGEENKERTIKAVIFLEEYEFIYTLQSTTAMPQFVADEYANPHIIYGEIDEKYFKVRSHYWTDINGNQNMELIHLLTGTVVDIVRNNSGIEFLDLAEELPSVSLSDLQMIVNVLEADEIIYTTYTKDEGGDLFEEGCQVCTQRLHPCVFLYEIGKSLVDPEFVRTKRWIHSTRDMIVSHSLILNALMPEKMSSSL